MSRNLHLGLDWGTSATKLVLRDNDAVGASRGLGYVLRAAGGGVRHPSLVVLEGGRLWFGDEAVARWPNATATWTELKARVALLSDGDNDEAGGLALRDLAALYLAHTLRVAATAAAKLPDGKGVRIHFKLGVPAAQLNGWMQATAYLAIARAAKHIAFDQGVDPDGFYPVQAKPILAAAWRHAEEEDGRARTTGEVLETWLRAEAASEMIWPLNSSTIRPGLYTAVDVGAGTTNACFFMIHDSESGAGLEGKRALTFYGAACSAPGLNTLLLAILGADATAATVDALRGKENAALFNSPARSAAAEPVVEKFRQVWFAARRQAWLTYPGNSHYDGLQLLTVGGGRTVDFVRRAFERTPPIQNIRAYGAVPDLGVPSDLRELPVRPGAVGRPFTDDPTFMFTAYGLSFETDDLPEITTPNGIPPFRPAGGAREFRGHEDLGYEKK